ncbi:hypothetical protein SAY87_009330 [Trapa incisa]|uniref:Protein SCAR n=1 Tax=Trapa incisa TaxID=236973 RepID=A0AAN7K1I1_9MYRT|nr:hypothetical protein SAY87_009330 [Trapa incisa]
MPLVRFQVRNEYGLGKPELYGEASREDPKTVLDGVAVAGLIGILRQLGDLAEFASEVFHGLQEQVTTTASRSRNLMGRVQRIEAALPSLEKRVLAQTSHIHFAYTAGSDWHARIQNEQHHFIDNDLPQFIMDSYEECRDPPRLQLLDRFDTGGPGSCLRRYSDPTFFRRVSLRIDEPSSGKIRRDKKSYKIKKKRSLLRNGEFSRGTSISNHGSRLRFSSPIANEQASPTVSMEDLTFDSGIGARLSSFDSRSGTGYIECIYSQSDNMHLDEHGSNKSLSNMMMQHDDSIDSLSHDEASSSASSIMRKKSFMTSSTLPIQNQLSIGSLLHEEESTSMSGSMGKEGSKTSSAPAMQLEDSVGSVSHKEQSTSTSSSMRKNNSKMSSSQMMQHENSFGSVSQEEEIASISSRKKCSKASSTQLMQSKDSVGSLSREENATISKNMMKEGSKASSTRVIQHEGSVGSVSLGEETTAISISSHSPSVIASSLSSLNWEQKTETVDLSEPNISKDPAPESVFAHLNVGKQEEAISATKVDELDMQCNRSNISKRLSSNEDQAYDNDSEVDHYVDALNTIESESETDIDFQTKHERQQFLASSRDTEIRVTVEKLTPESVDQLTSTIGFGATSDISSCKGMPLVLPEAGPEISAEKQSQVVGTPTDSDSLPRASACENYILDGSRVEAGLHDPSSSVTFLPQTEIRTSMHQESPIKLAGVDFWTNGGLLGLQPAKPPVFTPSAYADENTNLSVAVSTRKDDENGEKLHICEADEDSVSSNKINHVSSSSDPGTLKEKYSQSNHGNIFGRTNGHAMSSITVVAPGSAVPVAPTAKVVAAETMKENEENSSGVFGIGHKLFMNSFRKKLSLVYEEKSDFPISYISAPDGRQESSHVKVSETRIHMDQFQNLPSVNSCPPSPPLEHMRISFHPVNDPITSKLGLRFSDEGKYREKVSDMFASFQLVPQPAVQLDGSGSESEDDDDDDNNTFCQSSPSISDDCLSNHSESNFDSHNAFNRLSLEYPSVPSVYMNCVKEDEILQPDNGVKAAHTFSDCVSETGLNLPSFDSIKSLPKEELSGKPEPKNGDLIEQLTGQSTPLPPPLPPVQWRFMKPNSDDDKGKKNTSQLLDNVTFSNHLTSHIPKQPKLSPVMPQNFTEEIIQVSMERKKQQKSNVNNKCLPQSSCGNPSDDNDFLQQIRTKSFNLRRTVNLKPVVPTQAPTANVKVTAILQKANAIRQVVGSDDGEDDSWSDT